MGQYSFDFATNGLASVHYPTVSPQDLAEWVADMWPMDDTWARTVEIRGMEPVELAIHAHEAVWFTVVRESTGNITVRLTNPRIAHISREDLAMEYPARGERGPRASFTFERAIRAVRAFVVSRAEVDHATNMLAQPTITGFTFYVLDPQ